MRKLGILFIIIMLAAILCVGRVSFTRSSENKPVILIELKPAAEFADDICGFGLFITHSVQRVSAFLAEQNAAAPADEPAGAAPAVYDTMRSTWQQPELITLG